jgi:signal transduction histidine kinase/CHASE1-domain containing sensor protein
MERTPASSPARLRLHAAPAAVLITALLCALAAAFYVSRVVEAQEEARFRAQIALRVEALRDRMDAYTAMLRATRGLIEAVGGEPDVSTFRHFVGSLEIARNFPGIQGIGWTVAVAPDDLAQHQKTMRGLYPDYRVWPGGDRAFYSAITHLEPLDWRNKRAIGYDMFSDPIRREAMERARDTGEAAASGKVDLIQETEVDRQAGFLVYVPVYARAPTTMEERRRLLVGWVYAPFRAADLVAGAFDDVPARPVTLSVYDGAEPRPEALLFDGGPDDATSRRTRLSRLEVGGRTWTLRSAATPAFASRTERTLPLAVLVAGFAVAALLFWITRADATARGRAEKEALRSSLLADAGKALAATPDSEAAVPEVAGLAGRRFADACIVLLVGSRGATWIAGHRDPAAARRISDALAPLRPDDAAPLGIPEALASGEPRVDHDLSRARRERGDPAVAALRALGARSVLAVPLLARGAALGAIVLVWSRRRARIGDEDVALARDLARLVAGSIDAARLYRRAQEAVAARDEFLSIASHELKTPLTSLTLHADSLRAAARRGTLGEVERKADLIRRSVDRLARLVASLLDISRISAGRLELEIEDLDLAEVAREVVERFQDEARRAGTALVVYAEPARGRWDRAALDQVLTNLISNALKYGAGKPVVVRVEPRRDRAIVSVQDRGIGIPEADQRRIFQRFERAVSRRNYGGFGLGLWIVRELVEALGGTVRVESNPGAGSMFVVELQTGLRAEPPGDRARPTAPSP